jgi:hypothetical protein
VKKNLRPTNLAFSLAVDDSEAWGTVVLEIGSREECAGSIEIGTTGEVAQSDDLCITCMVTQHMLRIYSSYVCVYIYIYI